MNHPQAQKNKPKTNPIQTQSKPVLSAACPERSRMGRMGQFCDGNIGPDIMR